MSFNLQKADHKVNGTISDLQIGFLQNAGMERFERLKQAREKHFRFAKDAAASLGVPYGTYSGHEAGTRGIKDEDLQHYAKRFKVPLEWLSFGIGTDEEQALYELNVMGRIGAGAQLDVGVEQVRDGGEPIESVIPLPAGAIGFEVVGDSMWPRYDPGDVIVCTEQGTPLSELHDGEEAAVKTSQGLRYLKRVLRTDTRGIFNLESHNAATIRGVQLDWASDVVAVIRASKWRRITDADRRRLARKAMSSRS